MNVAKIKFIDRFAGTIIILIFVLIRPFISLFKPKTKEILCIQLWGIGETVLTLPAIKEIKNKYPKRKLTVLTTTRNHEVYKYADFIDEVRIIETSVSEIVGFMKNRIRYYDMVFDLEEYLNISAIITFITGNKRIGFSGQLRSLLYTSRTEYNDKQHVVETFLDLAKAGGVKKSIRYDKLISLKYDIEDEKKAENYIISNKLKGRYIIGITPGAAESGRARIWPHANYSKLADKLLHNIKNSVIVFIGSDKENQDIDNIISNIHRKENAFNSAGKFSLTELFAFTTHCKLFISNDTGPMHIAAAQGIKTIGLFGPNLPERFGPFGKVNKGIYKKTGCSPCINVHKGSIKDCKDARCMRKISVNDVLEAIE